jgi:hypothetical protein
MTTPEISAAAPLDAEREQLRKAGHTDGEISQILVARTLAASQQPAGAASQGVMSSVLSSIVAVGSYARGYIIGTKADFAMLFGTASPAARVKAGGSLVLKVVIVAVLGYAALQEWNQHIIYATQQAASDTYLKCQTRGGCPGIATDFEHQPISPEQIDRERAKLAALYNIARPIALNSPIVRAPDGRMVHEIGLILESDLAKSDFRFMSALMTKATMLNTPSINTEAGKDLYLHVPKWWLAEGETAP